MVAIAAAAIVSLGLAAAIILVTTNVFTATTKPEPRAVSFALQPVLEASPAPCAAGTVTSLDGVACYQLDQGMPSIRVEKAAAGLSGGTATWVVQVTLNKTDGDEFSALTEKLHKLPPPRNQLAIVIDGKVITAPTIAQPIPGPALEISGNFTQKDATDLAKRLAE